MPAQNRSTHNEMKSPEGVANNSAMSWVESAK